MKTKERQRGGMTEIEVDDAAPDTKEEASEKAKGLMLVRLEIEPAENGFIMTEYLAPKKLGKGDMGYAPPDKKVFADAKALCEYIESELAAHAE